MIRAQRLTCAWHKRKTYPSLDKWDGMLCGDAVEMRKDKVSVLSFVR